MPHAAATRWNTVLAHLQRRVPRESFETWFQHTELLVFEEGRLQLGVANLFVKNWIERNYVDLIAEILHEECGQRPLIEITISPRQYQAMRQAQQAERAAPPRPAPALAPVESGRHPALNPRFTLDAFVVGPDTRMAHAAALRVLENPGEYNPLFLYGDTGLGKTHLLHGICHNLSVLRPDLRVRCLAAEVFVHDFMRAVASRKLVDFRRQHRECQVLLVDDIHVLAQGNKAGTQAEFLHTLDTLLHAGHQVVVTAHTAPNNITGLDPRLASRLAAGLTAQVYAPSFETRCELVRRKAAQRELHLPEDMLIWIARRFPGNVRAIEGAIGRLAALVDLGGLTLNMRLMQEALAPAAPAPATPPKLEDIAQAVASVFRVPVADLKGRRRARPLPQARQLAFHLSRRLTTASLASIGRFYGGRSHATILSALKAPPRPSADRDLLRLQITRILNGLGVAVDIDRLFADQGELFPPPGADNQRAPEA